jgi:hypothetical protein
MTIGTVRLAENGTGLQQRLDLSQQPLEIHRFGVVVVGAGFDAFLTIAGHGMGGEGDDRDAAGGRIAFETGRLMSSRMISGFPEAAISTPS